MIIELGDDFEVPSSAPAPRGFSLRWLLRPRQPWVVRLLVPVVVLAVVGMSAAPPGRRLVGGVRIPLGAAASMIATGHELIVADIADAASSELTAYDIPTGRRLWTSRLALFAAESNLYLANGVVLASADDPNSDLGTEAFDLRTGKFQWLAPDNVAEVTSDGAPILVEPNMPGGAILIRADPRTGVQRWQLQLRTASDIGGDETTCPYQFIKDPGHGMADGVVQACTDRSDASRFAITTYDLTTGKPGPSTTQPAQIDSSHFDDYDAPSVSPELDVMGDIVLVRDQGATTTPVFAYTAGDLTARWTRVIGPRDQIDQCAAWMCVITDDRKTVIDPLTGTPTGQRPPPVTVPDGLVLMPVGGFANPEQITAVASIADGQLFNPPPQQISDMWVGVHRAGGWQLLYALPGVGPFGCVRLQSYLTCSTTGNEITLWPLP
jgi:PQQ-like domain